MKQKRKCKLGNRIVLLWLVMAMCLFWMTGCALPESESGSLTTQATSVIDNKQEGLMVHYIDVGQGDATLITCGEHAMLIDAGNNNMGTTVQLYLKKQGVSHLDYVVGTHPDADHIGGLDVILYKFDWDMFFMPNIEKDTKTYEEVVASVAEKRAKITTPTAGAEYSLGEADFTILGPVNTGEDANNSSIVIRLNYRDTHFLFNGDAEKEEEEEILSSGQDITADVYKVSHHGSAGANAADYVKKVQPQWAVISCGKNNSYGHPHKEVLSLLKKQGIQVLRTDLQGSVIAYSDGSTITFSSAVETPKEEKAGETEEEGAEKGNPTYIINENTKKFHLPDCDSVNQIQKNNVRESDETKEELQKEGYTPCKRCQP